MFDQITDIRGHYDLTVLYVSAEFEDLLRLLRIYGPPLDLRGGQVDEITAITTDTGLESTIVA